MIDCSFSGSENPLVSIKECLEAMDKMDNEFAINQDVHLTFKNATWLIPTVNLLLSHKITHLLQQGCVVRVDPPIKSSVREYMSTVGFPMGGKKVASTYCPIHHFNTNTQEEINKLMNVIQHHIPFNMMTPISYLLFELATNIDEHSQFTHATIMAQCYGKKGYIDIGVLDNGLSIPGLFERCKVAFSEDYEAINMALDGFSTKDLATRGKGLSSSLKLVSEGLKGEFYLVSRGGAIEHRTTERKTYKLQNNSLTGTLAYLRFRDPNKEIDIYRYV